MTSIRCGGSVVERTQQYAGKQCACPDSGISNNRVQIQCISASVPLNRSNVFIVLDIVYKAANYAKPKFDL